MAFEDKPAKKDIIFSLIFLGLAVLGLLAALSTLVLTAPETQAPFYDLAPFFLGLALAGGGVAVMGLARAYFRIAWLIVVITAVLWLMGTLLFAFGLSAIFYYDETADFAVNLGYVVGLCLGPGLLLAAIGLLLYLFEARRGRRQKREAAADWLHRLKSEEQANLENDDR